MPVWRRSRKAGQAKRAEQKKKDQEAAQLEKADARARKTAEKAAAVQSVLDTVVRKLGVDVESINSYEQLQQLTGKQLDALHWWKLRKGVAGLVREKLAAVAAALGVAVPAP